MTYAPHRIRRQRLEIRAPDRDTAFSLRAEMRRDLDEVLLPALEQAFNALGIGDEVVRIPRLAVQLRVRNAGELATTLASELPGLIAEQLEAALSGVRRGATPAQRRTAAEQARVSVLHYLLKGQLDWPDMQGEVATQAATLREEVIHLTQHWRDQPAALRRVLPAQYERVLAFFFRLLQLLPAALRDEWIFVMLAAAPVAGTVAQRQIAQGLRDLSALPVMSTLTEHSVLQVQAMTLAVAWADSVPAASALLPAVAALPGVNAIGIDVIETLILGEDAALRASARPMALPKNKAVPGKPSQDATRVFSPEAESAADAIAASDEASSEPSAGAPSPDVPEEAPHIDLASSDEEEGVALRVQAAGLVLAHPFLPSLLAARGLLDDDGKTIAAPNLPRAAALLHWLSCGRDEVFEFELGFIKTLLGLRPTDPLPVSQGLLDAADREECATLLGAMISHWPALRATSVAGLQVSFLQRQGLLKEVDEGLQSGWQLQLESESFDILLAQLPWSISIVRLPWMTRPIFTEWPTR